MYDSALVDFSVNFTLFHNNCNDDVKQIIYCNELKLHCTHLFALEIIFH